VHCVGYFYDSDGDHLCVDVGSAVFALNREFLRIHIPRYFKISSCHLLTQSVVVMPGGAEKKKTEPVLCVSGRSQWPRGLRRRSMAARLLRSWVLIPPRAWMFVLSVVCCQVEVSATS
jgi:hypothetical protein